MDLKKQILDYVIGEFLDKDIGVVPYLLFIEKMVKLFALSEEHLPIELPEDIDLSSPGNPLENHPTWKYTTCPHTGMNAIRETDTLDTFVDSAWYFLRFCSAKNDNEPFNKKILIIGCL